MKPLLKPCIVMLALMLLSTKGQALTLGEVELHSFINEPLKATLPFLSLSNEELANLSVINAAPEIYEKMDIPYKRIIKRLSIKVKENNHHHYLELTTPVHIKEPMFDVILRIRNGTGEIVHSITLMLQPKDFKHGSL